MIFPTGKLLVLPTFIHGSRSKEKLRVRVVKAARKKWKLVAGGESLTRMVVVGIKFL